MNNKTILFFILSISAKTLCPPTRDQAATRIQSVLRGHQARKAAKDKIEAVAKIQSASKKWLAKRHPKSQQTVSTPTTHDDPESTAPEEPKNGPWLSFRAKRRLRDAAMLGIGGGLVAGGMLAGEELKNIFSSTPASPDPIPVDPTPTDINPIAEQ